MTKTWKMKMLDEVFRFSHRKSKEEELKGGGSSRGGKNRGTKRAGRIFGGCAAALFLVHAYVCLAL